MTRWGGGGENSLFSASSAASAGLSIPVPVSGPISGHVCRPVRNSLHWQGPIVHQRAARSRFSSNLAPASSPSPPSRSTPPSAVACPADHCIWLVLYRACERRCCLQHRPARLDTPKTTHRELSATDPPAAVGGYRGCSTPGQPSTHPRTRWHKPALHLPAKTTIPASHRHPHGEGVAEYSRRNQIYGAYCSLLSPRPSGILRTQSAPLPQQPSSVLPPSPNAHVLAV